MKPITAETLYDLIFLDDPQISPDGARVAFTHQSVDRVKNGYTRNIWTAQLTGDAAPTPHTVGGKDGNPRWSADGKFLGFVSGRAGEGKVFALPTVGGEAHVIASHRQSVGGFEWSPDGRRVAFTASVYAGERDEEDKAASQPAPAGELSAAADRPPAKDEWQLKRDKEQRDHDEQLRLDPRVIRTSPFRTGTSFMDDRHRHVYVLDVTTNFAEKSDAKPRRLTDGEASYDAPHWASDGASVFSAVTRDPESGNLFRYRDAVRIPLEQPAEGARTYERRGIADTSCFFSLPSPDGKWLAVVGAKETDPGYNHSVLYVLLNEDAVAAPIALTPSLDNNITRIKWAKDNAGIYFTMEQNGRHNLWRVGVPDGTVEQLTDDQRDVTAFDVAADGRVVFVASAPRDPCALFVREADGAVRELFAPNAKTLGERAIGDIEDIWFESDGRDVHGWIVKPPNFDPTKKYPLALQIHGGPHVQWTAAFPSIWHENQTLANRGYVVFYCNPRGSDGYGQDFVEANRGDWGDGPTRDVLRGVDAVVARGYVDDKRMAITGGSYGGYLTAWIIGHDHRFAAACSQRGVYNLISMRGTTDIPFFNDRESGATPWDNVDKLWQLSPLAHAPNISTPLFIEHSEQDFRVPIEQAEQLFTALKLMKKTVELVRWPREGHEISRAGEPLHRLERMKRIVEWFDRYCQPASD